MFASTSLWSALVVLSLVSADSINITEFFPSDVGAQAFVDRYSLLKQVGGAGPYSTRSGDGISPDPPQGCYVDQVVMLKRHGERFPDSDNSAEYETTLAKVNKTPASSRPASFAFLNSWTYYANSSNYGQLTSTGPYAGTSGSVAQGEYAAEKWKSLYVPGDKLHVWASDYPRVVDTAKNFVNGFFGDSKTAQELAEITVISEDPSQGANSLTPSCSGLGGTDCDEKHADLDAFNDTAARLNALLPSANLESDDVLNLLYIAAYELNSRGWSPWVDVFTREEWIAFEYWRSYRMYCEKSLKSPNSVGAGSLLANATVTLLNQGPLANQNLTFAFAHDTQISALIGALDLFSSYNDFQVNSVTFHNNVDIADIVPMGAHIAFERLNCGGELKVRVVLNDAVVPLDWCSDQPGYSCKLSDFSNYVLSRYEKDGWPNCKHKKGTPAALTFFWS